MRKATDKEINDFIKYRSNHVALVQRIGRVVFDEDFSDHDHDKIEADGETLNLYALRNAMIEGNYQAHGDDKKLLSKLAGEHVCSQPHHPEYWCTEITPNNFDDDNPPQCTPSRMTDRRILEMIADWSAVALKRNQPLFKWYNQHCVGPDARFLFTDHQRKLIEEGIQKIIDSIEKEHLEYPGVKYTAKQVEPKTEEKLTEDDCGGVCGVGMSAGFQAMAPEHAAKLGDGSGLIDPSGKLKLTEENITGNVLKHMTHSEDLILMGRAGSMLLLKTYKDIFNALKGNNPTSRITQKIDGAPAVIAATDFHGKKFVALKHSWDNGKIFQSVGEIRANYAERPDLCAKLEYLFNELDAINIPKDEIWHGDFLYHIDDIREASIDGKDYIIFSPNTLVYAIPKSDPLAEKILDSVIGIAWHTKYTGETDNFKEVKISFDVSVSSVNDVPEVYQMDARIPSLAGKVTMTAEETDDTESKLNSLELLVHEVTADDGYEALVYNETLTLLINTYRNHIIKDSNNQFPDVKGLKDWIIGRYDAEKEKKKTDKGKSAVETRKQEIIGAIDDALVSKIFEAQKIATELKEMFITKLNSLSGMKSFVNHISQGYISTSGEGFAVSDVDGNVYKLVSRLEFSRNNFSKEIIKGWQSERRMNENMNMSALKRLRIR